MKPLADRIFDLIPATLTGLSLKDAMAGTRQDAKHVRAAFDVLHGGNRVILVKRGRGTALYIVHLGQKVRACVICLKEFQATRKQTKTCSYSCGRHLAWQNEDMRARHKISVKRAANTPQRIEKMTKLSRTLCAKPAERLRRSECNRRNWADPEIRTRRIISIKEAWKGDAAKERIAKASSKKNALWSDTEWKAATVAAMRSGRRGRFKRVVIDLANVVPSIPEEEIAARLGMPLRKVKILMYLANKTGELERAPVDGRKLKQSEALVRNRVEKTRITKRHHEGPSA